MKSLSAKIIIVFIAAIFLHQVLQDNSEACNIAVVSAKESATGRPFIWKNRDHPNSYRHEVVYVPEKTAGVGGSVRLMGETSFVDGKTVLGIQNGVCVGGANESGFAITNTTCVDIENDPLDSNNVNPDLMVKAVEDCKTLKEFEDNVIKKFKQLWPGKNISGIFAVIDANGGAVIYEMWTNGNGKPIMYRKYDADTGQVTDENGNPFNYLRFPQTTGFLNRTNSNHAYDPDWSDYTDDPDKGWIQIWSDTPRELRARQLLSGMKAKAALSPRNIMRFLSKDVLGGDTKAYCSDEIFNGLWTTNGYTDSGKYWFNLVQNNWDASEDSWDNPNYDGELFSRYALSRYQTSMGLVIEGAASEEQVKLTTMWVALGEPSLSIFIPYFPYANSISKYATDDKHNNSGYYWDGTSTTSDSEDNSFLNLLFDCVQANPFKSSHELYNTYKAISLYDNNGVGLTDEPSARVFSDNIFETAYLTRFYMDNTINYPRLVSLQTWTFPLEDIVIRNTNLLMAVLRENPELVTRELLAGFSEYCNSFVYKNYSNQSASFLAWNYVLPEPADDEDIPGDYNDPGNEDPYYDDDDYEGEPEYDDPGSIVSTNPSSGGGCGMSALASSGRISQADRLSGLMSLMITMLFPLCLIMIRRVYRKRRD